MKSISKLYKKVLKLFSLQIILGDFFSPKTDIYLGIKKSVKWYKQKKIDISVIMPARNAEEFLEDSIRSILNQTFKNFEFIIINDGSTDNSLKIIKKYAKENERIKIINNIKNLGLNKSINKGLKKAKGKYIARFDADDIALPKRLKIQYNYLERNPEIFLIGSSAFVIDKKGHRVGFLFKYQIHPLIMKWRLKRSNSLIHPSIMFRNDGTVHYKEANRNPKLEDERLIYLDLLRKNKKIVNLPSFLIKYRVNPKGMSTNAGVFSRSKWKKYLKK